MAVSINKQDELSLSKEDRDFVNFVHNRITMYGQIPYRIPDQAVRDLIISSAKLFYKYYSGAWERTFYKLLNSDVVQHTGTSNFVDLSISVDPRIRIIEGIFETNTTRGRYTYDDGDQFATGTVAGAYANRPELSGINNNLYLLEFAVKMVEQRAYDNIFKSRLPFHFNQATNTLFLKRMPQGESMMLKVSRDIPIHKLYNDSFFERHVIACYKRELKRVIGGHTVELPGGVTMSADEICNNIEDAEKVEDLIKSGSGMGDIILKRY